jgi:membrane protein
MAAPAGFPPRRLGVNVVGRITGTLAAARRRSLAFDHFWRAMDLYGQVLGARLAAAIAYYGFFAVFALSLVAYWAFGFVLNRSVALQNAVEDFLQQNLPFLDRATIQESSGTVGIVGLAVLVLTGIAWVEAIRSSQRFIYGVPQQPGNIITRRVVDLAVLVIVFALLALSVAAADGVESLLRSFLPSVVLRAVSWVLTGFVNLVLAAALLVAIPRLRMAPRRLLPAMLVVAVGITLLNSLGREYVVRADRNPAYTVVTGAVGLLMYLYLLNQLLLFGAALAATSSHGKVVDLSAQNNDQREEDRPS